MHICRKFVQLNCSSGKTLRASDLLANWVTRRIRRVRTCLLGNIFYERVTRSRNREPDFTLAHDCASRRRLSRDEFTRGPEIRVPHRSSPYGNGRQFYYERRKDFKRHPLYCNKAISFELPVAKRIIFTQWTKRRKYVDAQIEMKISYFKWNGEHRYYNFEVDY